MTVKDLIKHLKKLDPETLVVERADMTGYDLVQGFDPFEVVKLKDGGTNGYGAFKQATSSDRKRKRKPAILFHSDPECAA